MAAHHEVVRRFEGAPEAGLRQQVALFVLQASALSALKAVIRQPPNRHLLLCRVASGRADLLQRRPPVTDTEVLTGLFWPGRRVAATCFAAWAP
jgi:hypothetical protein